jgi:hypothetical protein
MARLVVGDQAVALLVGGQWLEAVYHLVNSEARSNGEPTHWVSVGGEVIPVAAVAATRLTRGPRVSKFAADQDDVTGRARCPSSGGKVRADLWTAADDDGPAMGYCTDCEQEVPAPGRRYAEHDQRGRDLDSATDTSP